jgi:hypothetical protein
MKSSLNDLMKKKKSSTQNFEMGTITDLSISIIHNQSVNQFGKPKVNVTRNHLFPNMLWLEEHLRECAWI